MKFTKIGSGSVKTVKSGKKAIQLTLDKGAKKAILDNDFENKVWIFKTFVATEYSVLAVMPDDYIYKQGQPKKEKFNVVKKSNKPKPVLPDHVKEYDDWKEAQVKEQVKNVRENLFGEKEKPTIYKKAW